MNIEELTIKQAKELAAMFPTVAPGGVEPHPYPVGKNVFIRTITMYYTGRIVRVTNQELILEDAAWIADCGRFSQSLTTGSLSEVEPFPAGEVIVSRGAILDCSEWRFPLPREVK